MWQLFALGSLVGSAVTSSVDKFAILAAPRLDAGVATFLRYTLFVMVTALIGATGLVGALGFYANWLLFGVAVFSVVNALAYTYLLRYVEVTEIGVMGYVLPFVFFAIDTKVLGIHFSDTQIMGIILLIVGGLAFALDGKTHHLRRDFSLPVMGMFVLSGLNAGVVAYSFKYLNAHMGLNGVSFYVSHGLMALVILLGFVALRGKAHLLLSRQAFFYAPRAAIGKTFDAIANLLFAQALIFAAVSQVSAFQALAPLVLMLCVALMQGVLHLRLKEALDPPHALWKTGAVFLLVTGGFLVT